MVLSQCIHHLLLAKSLKLSPSRLELYKDANRIPVAVRQAALSEACDCFSGLIQSKKSRQWVMNCMAALWALGAHDVEILQDLSKPTIQVRE